MDRSARPAVGSLVDSKPRSRITATVSPCGMSIPRSKTTCLPSSGLNSIRCDALDFPDADLNLSYRLQQLTSMKVDPHGRIMRLTDPDLFRYPFIYLIEPGGIYLSPEEITALRRYLLNGGFLMVDDFWGEEEWRDLYNAMKQVFPEREPVELPLEHPIFHCVYDLKEKPQIPAIGIAIDGRSTGKTWEREDAKTPHYRGIFDDQGRLMALICHNTDLGDGWEREGEDPWYFTEFSEKKAYPLGINIIFYAMTH